MGNPGIEESLKKVKLTIEIELSNDAFNDGGYLNTDELRRVLSKIPDKIGMAPMSKVSDMSGTLMDVNGNNVGEWVIL